MSFKSLIVCLAVMAFELVYGCEVDGVKRKDQETWVVRNAFIMGCDMKPNGAWETKVVGCVTPGGTQIRSGQTAADTQGSFKCTKGADGVVRLEQVSTAMKGGAIDKDGSRIAPTRADRQATCSYEGQKRQNGDVWSIGKYSMTCFVNADGSWVVKVSSCQTPGGFDLPVGESRTEGKTRYTCTRTGNTGAILNSE